MKNVIFVLFFAGCLGLSLYSQAPEAINYQVVTHDASGNLLVNQPVRFRLSILKNNPAGTVVFSESHAETTNAFGLATLSIGAGTLISGNFAAIDWAVDVYYLKTELDPSGGATYQVMGTSQFLSVPYALHAKTAANGGSSLPAGTTSATLYHNGTNWTASTLLYNTNTRIGIGTSTPNQQLEITGNIRMPASTTTAGNIYKGSNVFIHNKGTNNLYVGEYSGTLSATASNNTALGAYSLYYVATGSSQTAVGASALRNTTTGANNTAVGHEALFSNKANSRNTAIGKGAMYYADDRSSGQETYNTAIGFEALKGSSTPSANTGIWNTAVGDQALNSNTAGEANTAIGASTLRNNTYGYKNTASGAFSLAFNTLGSENTATGYKALLFNTIGGGNTANGTEALTSNTEGGSNTANGTYTLYYNTTGNSNTAGGCAALYSNTTGNYNTAWGGATLYYNTTGDFITAIGARALLSNNANSRSTAVGYQAMENADDRTSGRETYNTAIGFEALKGSSTPSANTGRQNTAIGDQALYVNTSGEKNTAIGYKAGSSNTSGSNNICVGDYAGANITTGSNNIVIGSTINVPSASSSNQMVIGNASTLYGDLSNYRLGIGTTSPSVKMHVSGSDDGLIRIENTTDNKSWDIGYESNASEDYFFIDEYGSARRFTIRTGGNVGIGTGSPNALLQLVNGTANRKIVLNEDTNNDHQFYGFGVNASVLRYQVPSTTGDHVFYAGSGAASSNELARIKGNGTLKISSLTTNGPVYSNNNILTNTNPSDRNLKEKILSIENSLEKILALRPVTFNWKSNGLQGIGFIAQEVETVIPELVNTSEDGTKGLYSVEMIPFLVKAIQEQQQMIEEQRKWIEELQLRVGK